MATDQSTPTRGQRTKHPLYNLWAQMIKRCVDPRTKGYRNYGGRGIRVCNRWMDEFWDFVSDVGTRPSPKHSLDRFPNNDGHYEPGNVRWATVSEQRLNTRCNKPITFQGETLPVTEWARRVGIHPATLFWRLRRGVPVDVALTARPIRGHVIGGESLGERLLAVGLERSAYHARIAAGWTEEQALSTPRYQRRPKT